jgi:dienelactone hydrolase
LATTPLAVDAAKRWSIVMRLLLFLLGTLIAPATAATSCLAGALIEIPGADPREKPLPAYLARPPGAGPFPAVVVLHGCSGFGTLAVGWADRLAQWGYVALAIDSLTPRGKRSACGSGFRGQPVDTYQGLKFLASQPFVRADRVAVLGMSMGAGSVLTALERGLIEPMFSLKFRSGVAFYPGCAGASGVMTAPTLVLVGELDDWTPAAPCRQMAAGESDSAGPPRRPGDRSMVELVVYPSTYHAFLADLPAGFRTPGHWLEYNDAAAHDAISRVHSFFERTLGN